MLVRTVRCRPTILLLVVAAASMTAAEEPSPLVQLLLALNHGDPKTAQKLAQSGMAADPALMHTCAQKGFYDAAKKLIELGAKVDEQFERYGTPLHTAASNGQTRIAALLVEHGSGVDEPNTEGFRPIQIASQNGKAPVVELLLKKGARVNDGPNSATPSPLHLAAAHNHVEVVRALLKHSAKVNSRMKTYGWTPLHTAASEGQAESLSILLEAGADVHAVDSRGFSALHLAATGTKRGHKDVLQHLVAHNADVHLIAPDMLTALHVAAEENNAEGVRVLVAAGADIEAKNSKGFTPLARAVSLGKPEAVEALLGAGAERTTYTNKMLTPLHEAAQERLLPELQLLLRHGAHVDPPDQVGATPLAHAAREGWVEMVQALLEGGADCGASDESGVTALHLAASEGHAEVARVLLQGCGGRGGVGAETNAGHRALHAAAFDGQTEVARLLLEGGADAAARTKGGLTALEVALRQHKASHGVVKLLQEHTPDPGGASQREAEQVCVVEREGIAAAVAGAAAWPWHDEGLKAVGAVNVSFSVQEGQVTTVSSRVLPLYAMPVLRMEDVARNDSTGSPLAGNMHMQAAALHTAPALAEQCRKMLKEVKRQRRKLSAGMGVSSRRFWSTHWPMTTMVEKTEAALQHKAAHAPQLRKLQQAVERLIDHIRAPIAPMLGCAVDKLACPDFGVYYRIDPDHYLSYVHLDFPSEAEAKYNRKHGVTRDDTWNVWVLLSENTYNGPLALLDPSEVAAKGPGFLNPPSEASPWRAFTYDGMRQGDTIVWRTTKVPHAGGRAVRGEEAGWEDSEAAHQQRESIDIRCTCIP